MPPLTGFPLEIWNIVNDHVMLGSSDFMGGYSSPHSTVEDRRSK